MVWLDVSQPVERPAYGSVFIAILICVILDHKSFFSAQGGVSFHSFEWGCLQFMHPDPSVTHIAPPPPSLPSAIQIPSLGLFPLHLGDFFSDANPSNDERSLGECQSSPAPGWCSACRTHLPGAVNWDRSNVRCKWGALSCCWFPSLCVIAT